MRIADIDSTLAGARRRRLALEPNELTLSATTIAAGGGFVTSPAFYTPGFVHFSGQLDAVTPAATTLEVRIQPTILDNALFVNNEFPVTVLTTFAAGVPNRYGFYWGQSRGVVLDAFGSGASFVIASTWRFILRNTGGNVATGVNIVIVEMI